MHRFRLWAPNAGKVSVQIAEQKYPLQKHDGGWWQANIESAQPGMDYAYFLADQAPALPDRPSRAPPPPRRASPPASMAPRASSIPPPSRGRKPHGNRPPSPAPSFMNST